MNTKAAALPVTGFPGNIGQVVEPPVMCAVVVGAHPDNEAGTGVVRVVCLRGLDAAEDARFAGELASLHQDIRV